MRRPEKSVADTDWDAPDEHNSIRDSPWIQSEETLQKLLRNIESSNGSSKGENRDKTVPSRHVPTKVVVDGVVPGEEVLSSFSMTTVHVKVGAEIVWDCMRV
ncbi:hypothetical protein PM082_010642 [Marasmius tenuissimus]|nr:hypothetical protein PM082_010642 [Marasmius tenuissimus]